MQAYYELFTFSCLVAHFRITHLFDSEVLIIGIQGLLPFLSTYRKEISFAELEGKVCGIDANSCTKVCIVVHMNWLQEPKQLNT